MPRSVTIALDVMSGDNGPLPALLGAFSSLKSLNDLNIILVGDQSIIKNAMSDLEDPNEIVRAFEAGIDNYLLRPVEDLALLEKIEYCWQKRKCPASA